MQGLKSHFPQKQWVSLIEDAPKAGRLAGGLGGRGQQKTGSHSHASHASICFFTIAVPRLKSNHHQQSHLPVPASARLSALSLQVCLKSAQNHGSSVGCSRTQLWELWPPRPLKSSWMEESVGEDGEAAADWMGR